MFTPFPFRRLRLYIVQAEDTADTYTTGDDRSGGGGYGYVTNPGWATVNNQSADDTWGGKKPVIDLTKIKKKIAKLQAKKAKTPTTKGAPVVAKPAAPVIKAKGTVLKAPVPAVIPTKPVSSLPVGFKYSSGVLVIGGKVLNAPETNTIAPASNASVKGGGVGSMAAPVPISPVHLIPVMAAPPKPALPPVVKPPVITAPATTAKATAPAKPAAGSATAPPQPKTIVATSPGISLRAPAATSVPQAATATVAAVTSAISSTDVIIGILIVVGAILVVHEVMK